MGKKIYNFSAGPSMMPPEVLREAYDEFFDFKNSGMSVMELNHRSILFNEIIEEAEHDLRELMGIPDNYKVLFLQGGASLQFSAIPMNLMKHRKAGYILTGHWAKRAYEEASMYGKVIALASSQDRQFSYIPDCDDLNIEQDMDYIHICENNTIYGTEYHKLPDTKGVDLVSDQSSCILSRQCDVSKYALIYAGAQKNMGPSGVTVVIVRNDLIRDKVLDGTPYVMRYKNQADNNSRYNTPSCYGIYLCGKEYKWLLKNGGIAEAEKANRKKANLLYNFIDNSKLFKGTAEKDSRSVMNVTFTTGNPDIDMDIVEDSKKYGFVSIKGHRFVGGLRATLYNAIPIENVEALIDYLESYEKRVNYWKR